MKSYSLDVRQKIVESYESGEITQRQLAAQFRVTTFQDIIETSDLTILCQKPSAKL